MEVWYIVNQDGVLHYIIDVQGTLVRRHVDQIRPVGDQVQETSSQLFTRDFHQQRFEKQLKYSACRKRKIFLRIEQGIGFIFRTRSAIN
ncbi:hypothetical protein TNCT_163941 [Trichonephila clavata]|uniref:Uncharacterized protein n=1 Tax=Trichonephila clavata TaxID=2740835 RepID=A0A8X6HJL0_TRICU|nr:hypothetical protein TNCT_163941 [Trichonephila clavata]